MHRELQTLYEQHRADRHDLACVDQAQCQRLLWRDAARRERVEALLASEGNLLDAQDYFHAAMVFQHGETPKHFFLAHTLAYQGARQGHLACFSLMAAPYDRLLMSQGHPQKYGTQYIIQEGRWVLFAVDPATTDEQRARWNVPPLAQCLHKAEEMNQSLFSPSM